MHHCPVARRGNGHLRYGKILIEYVERRGSACASCAGNCKSGFMLEHSSACVKHSVEKRKHSSAGVCVIYGRTEYETVAIFCHCDKRIDYIVVENARIVFEDCPALVATYAISYGCAAEIDYLILHSLFFKDTYDLLQGSCRTALRLCTSVDKQYFHILYSLY